MWEDISTSELVAMFIVIGLLFLPAAYFIYMVIAHA